MAEDVTELDNALLRIKLAAQLERNALLLRLARIYRRKLGLPEQYLSAEEKQLPLELTQRLNLLR